MTRIKQVGLFGRQPREYLDIFLSKFLHISLVTNNKYKATKKNILLTFHNYLIKITTMEKRLGQLYKNILHEMKKAAEKCSHECNERLMSAVMSLIMVCQIWCPLNVQTFTSLLRLLE